MLRTFRQSEIKSFLTCPREWWLKYVRALSKPWDGVDTGQRDVGTLVHAGLESHYLGDSAMGRIAELKEAVSPDLQAAVVKEYALAERMVEGYLEWLEETGADQGWQVNAVERQLEVPFGQFLGDDVTVTGKLDLDVHDSWGLAQIVDNKTVQTFDQANQLYLDFQMRTYALMKRMLGEPVDGVIHNQLRRVLRSKTATPPFYNRVPMRYNAHVLNNHDKHLRSTIAKMVSTLQALEGGVDHHFEVPPVPTRDCGWRCDFFTVCGMLDDGSDAEGYLEERYAPAGTLVTLRKEGDADVS